MKTGYVTYLICTNYLEGVKIRRMLNAPISMNFKHTLRSYMTREKLDLHSMIERSAEWMPENQIMRHKSRLRLYRYGIDCERWLDVRGIPSGDELNWQLNQDADFLVKEANLIVKNVLMQEYNRQTLLCYARNRERYSTYG